MTTTAAIDDDLEADLGLGNGLKPGALTAPPANPPKDMERHVPVTNQSSSEHAGDVVSNASVTDHSDFAIAAAGFSSTDSEEEMMMLMPIGSIQELKMQYSHLIPKSSRSTEIAPNLKDGNYFYDERYFKPGDTAVSYSNNNDCQLKTKCSCKSKDAACEACRRGKCEMPSFPEYADVQYGTSIRQQKELFNHNLEKIRSKKDQAVNMNAEAFKTADASAHQNRQTAEEIALKLATSLQEVEELKAELEACELRLDSKYKAIDILRKQAEEEQKRLKRSEYSAKETTMKLAQEVNELQFEILCRDNTLADCQQIWAQRFDRMCEDNRALSNQLDIRTQELRKLTSRVMAVERENDELLALLDIQERAKYEKARNVTAEENYCSFSSSQLAILGACRCRVSSPNPCTCALSAANLKKIIVDMKAELLQYKTRRDEAYHTVDAYRLAFEEQLQKNKVLTLQLANISTGRSTQGSLTGRSRARIALRWLIGSLNDEELEESEGPGPSMTEYELITYLTDMLNEKKEVLAHQRLASQILADRVKTLEEKLDHYENTNGNNL